MNQPEKNSFTSNTASKRRLALWLFKNIARLAPAEFRKNYSSQMARDFALQIRDMRAAKLFRYTVFALKDLIYTLIAEHKDTLCTYMKGNATMQKYQNSLFTVFGSYIAFITLGLFFNGSLDDSAYVAQKTGPTFLGLRLLWGSASEIVYNLIGALALLALAAALIGGAPAALYAWRHKPEIRRQFLYPIIGFAMVIFAPAVVIHVWHSATGVTVAKYFAAHVVYFVWFAVWAFFSAKGVITAIRSADTPAAKLLFARWPALVVTASMVLMTIAVFIYGIMLQTTAQQFRSFAVANNLTMGSWLLFVLGMAVASGIALLAYFRGNSALLKNFTSAA